MARWAQEGFLEKMLGPLPGQDPDKYWVRWVGEPILDHLNLLLNTRQGSSRLCPDYGLPDISSFYANYPTSLGELREILEAQISKYEPRLLNLRVKVLDIDSRDFKASFLISGEVQTGHSESRKVRYRTTISANGQSATGTGSEDDEN